jgi:RHS repeat-associated protein
MRENSVVYYLHGDHLGSTSLVTCGSTGGCKGTPYQGVVAEQLYLPYGAPRWISGTLPTDFTFTGQRADATGLMFFKARYYSSSLGRFISADTMVPSAGNSADLNRYSYARNNPLNYMDPSGHGPISEWLISVGRSGPVGKALVVSMGFIAEQPNKVFYPGPNTSMADRWLASTMVGGGSVIAGWYTEFCVKVRKRVSLAATIQIGGYHDFRSRGRAVGPPQRV